MKKYLCLATFILCLGACQREVVAPEPKPAVTPKQPSVTYPVKRLLVEGMTPVLVETTAEALPIWRKYASVRPTLLLLASEPSLQPYPEKLKGAISDLVKSAEQPALRKSAIAAVANPLLLPDMTLSAALDAGFFSRVIWLIPLKPDTTLTLQQFCAKLVAQGVLTEKEGAAFRVEGGNFVGTIRHIPFLATTTTIPASSGPLLFHLDLSDLRPGYHSEIRKPLHLHLRETLQKLRDNHLQVIAGTISLSNLSGDLPLSTRFLGGMIRDLFAEPQRLDGSPSSQEKLRAEAMYLANFFRKEEVLKKYQEMEGGAPQDPSVKYDLYQTLRQFNRTTEALEKLREAVALDSVYGLEYLALAELAFEKGQPDGALQMYEKAARIFPDNPFIPLFRARIYAQLGHPEKVKEMLEPVQGTPWSKVYYPRMQAEVGGLLAAAGKLNQ